MKKRLEAELISIAHRVLKLKNKSEIDQLYKESQKLYEAISILKFYGDNYETLKESISAEEIEEKVGAMIDAPEEEVAVPVETEMKVAETEETEETKEIVADAETEAELSEAELSEAELSEAETEEESIIVGEVIIDEEELEESLLQEAALEDETENATMETETETETEKEVSFMPSFELSFEEEKETTEEIVEKAVPLKQITMDDVFAGHFEEPVFVKPEENIIEKFSNKSEEKETTGKIMSLNDSLSNTISIGLNDRIGFVKHLFNESNEDYNRVMSQLNTFDTFDEAKTFLNEMVIPDYNYWVGKEEYLERFMEIVEKKFK